MIVSRHDTTRNTIPAVLFARFAAGNTLAQLASELHKFTLILLSVGTLNATNAHMGLVGAAPFLGMLIFGLVAGALCKRAKSNKVLAAISSTKAIAAALGVFLLSQSLIDIHFVIAALLIFSICEAFYSPSFTTYLARLSVNTAGERDSNSFSQRLATTTTIDQVVRIAVPAVTGTLIATIGPTALLLATCCFSFVSALCFLTLPHNTSPTSKNRTPPWRDMWTATRSGVAYVRNTPLLLSLFSILGVMNLTAGTLVAVLPLYAMRSLEMTTGQYGLAMGLGALAGLLGGYLSHMSASRIGRVQTMTIALIFLPQAYALLTLPKLTSLPAFWCLCLSEATFALVILVYAIQSSTLLSVATPDELLSRTTSIRQVISIGAFPVGSLAGGVLSAAFGPFMTVLCGLALAFVPLALLLATRSHLKDPSEAAVTSPT